MAKAKKQIKKQMVRRDEELFVLGKCVEAYQMIIAHFWRLDTSDGGRKRVAKYIVSRFGDFIHNIAKTDDQ